MSENGMRGVAAAVVGVVIAAGVPVAAFAQGCAMCATYLTNGDPRANAFKTAILFLMTMPFAVAGTAGGWILWMYRRHRGASVQVTPVEGEVVS